MALPPVIPGILSPLLGLVAVDPDLLVTVRITTISPSLRPFVTSTSESPVKPTEMGLCAGGSSDTTP